jgi:hypothetical protein
VLQIHIHLNADVFSPMTYGVRQKLKSPNINTNVPTHRRRNADPPKDQCNNTRDRTSMRALSRRNLYDAIRSRETAHTYYWNTSSIREHARLPARAIGKKKIQGHHSRSPGGGLRLAKERSAGNCKAECVRGRRYSADGEAEDVWGVVWSADGSKRAECVRGKAGDGIVHW